jgi:hypothetical protein
LYHSKGSLDRAEITRHECVGPAVHGGLEHEFVSPPEAAGLDQSSGRASGWEYEAWLNQWITAAIAQEIGAVETAADFFKRRSGNASPEDLRAFLADAPDVPPEPGDEIPDHLRVRRKPASARG